MAHTQTQQVGFIVLTNGGKNIVLFKVQLNVTPFVLAVTVLGLEAGVVADFVLGKDVGDIVLLVVVLAIAVGFETGIAGTQ